VILTEDEIVEAHAKCVSEAHEHLEARCGAASDVLGQRGRGEIGSLGERGAVPPITLL
jgi:hypothetical protein